MAAAHRCCHSGKSRFGRPVSGVDFYPEPRALDRHHLCRSFDDRTCNDFCGTQWHRKVGSDNRRVRSDNYRSFSQSNIQKRRRPGPNESTSEIAPLADFAISYPTVKGPTHRKTAIDDSFSQAKADTDPTGPPRTISLALDPTAPEALGRLSSIKDVVSGGLTGGRQTHWKAS